MLALALDALAGDPPTAAHPVGWLGRVARFVEAHAPAAARPRRWYGALAAVSLPLVVAVGWGRLVRHVGRRGTLVAVVTDALALDASVALRSLLRRADEVQRALERGDIAAARRLLGRHLVSRDTRDLTAGEVAGATIESVAENLSDGVIAPWIAYAALGVRGALAYRVINTLDAMWGYRTAPYLDLGWAAARLDDGANWIPARATALAIVVAAAATRDDARAALETWRRDGGVTESPNAGRPMAAMAGALGVVLVKRDAYRLGESGRTPVAQDIARAIRVARIAAGIAAACIAVTLLLPAVRTAGSAR